jgi:CHASE2 domain-containing sensor protein
MPPLINTMLPQRAQEPHGRKATVCAYNTGLLALSLSISLASVVHTLKLYTALLATALCLVSHNSAVAGHNWPHSADT